MKHHTLENLENTLFLGIDIGTETCKVVLLKTYLDAEGEYKYHILEANEAPSNAATDRSRILNIDKTIEMLSKIIEKTTNKYSGAIYTSFTIHDSTLRSKINRACNPFSKYDRMIEQADVDIALKMAGNAHIDNEREYLHVLPRAFYVNGKPIDEGPAGLVGSSLEAEVLLVSVLRDSIKQIIHCANEVDFPCNFICATPFATGEAVLTEKEKESGALVIDFGAGVTSATLFENKMPRAMSILPLGGIDITNDIRMVLKLPTVHAEFLKQKYGIVDKEYLSMFDSGIRIEVNQQIIDIQLEDIYQVVKARTAEIIGLLKQKLYTSNDPFPYPIVVTGGSARILGLKQLVEQAFKSSTRIAQPWNWGGPYEVYRDPRFSSVIGVCIAGLKHYKINGWESFVEQNNNAISSTALSESFKKIYTNMSDRFKKFLSLGDIE